MCRRLVLVAAAPSNPLLCPHQLFLEMDKSNLIVNYLQTNVTEEDLSRLFSEYGFIQSLKIVRDKGTGISMGFGFVNFETNHGANTAAEALNGLELNGKRIKVSVARPAWKANIHSNLYIANLPTEFTEDDVLDLVGPALAVHIEHVRMLKNTEQPSHGGDFRGVAVARFDTEESACAALELLCLITMESPITGTRYLIHAKPWRPEFRPERAATGGRRGRLDSTVSSNNTAPAPPPAPLINHRGPVLVRPPTVGGRPISPTEECILSSSFEQFGAIPGLHIYNDRSWGFVRFPTMRAAMAAVNNLTGFNVNGKILELEAAAM